MSTKCQKNVGCVFQFLQQQKMIFVSAGISQSKRLCWRIRLHRQFEVDLLQFGGMMDICTAWGGPGLGPGRAAAAWYLVYILNIFAYICIYVYIFVCIRIYVDIFCYMFVVFCYIML